MPVTLARPINERIAVTLFNRLRYLTAGYTSTSPIREVIRPKRREDMHPQHMQLVLTQDDPEELPELFVPGNPPRIAWSMRFNIYCHVMPSEKDPTPIDEYTNVVAADVVRAITLGSADWFRFGGLAIDAQFQPIEMIDAEGGIDGCNVPLVVAYRTSELDPYSLGTF